MGNRTDLAREALRSALRLRRSRSIPRESPINIYDLASGIGIDVRFQDAPSLEGMYVRDPGPVILLPSLAHRPKGRVGFSCAHEVGHHQFEHGTRVDRYWDEGQKPSGFEPEEFLANVFASYLLMPRQAVISSFARRQWSAEKPEVEQVFTVAGELGVGYDTLLTHLHFALEILASARHSELSKASPKSIRAQMLGTTASDQLLIVDEHWGDVPIDAEVGDLIILPPKAGEIPLLERHPSILQATLFRAARAGVAAVTLPTKTVKLRIARRGYVGPFDNRFESDPDEH